MPKQNPIYMITKIKLIEILEHKVNWGPKEIYIVDKDIVLSIILTLLEEKRVFSIYTLVNIYRYNIVKIKKGKWDSINHKQMVKDIILICLNIYSIGIIKPYKIFQSIEDGKYNIVTLFTLNINHSLFNEIFDKEINNKDWRIQLIIDTPLNNKIKLRRKERIKTLERLNSTPHYLNIKYINKFIEIINDKEIINKIPFHNNIQKIRRKIIEEEIIYILRWVKFILQISSNGEKAIYFKWHVDFRGRYYPILRNFKIIGPKYIKEIFITQKENNRNMDYTNIFLKNEYGLCFEDLTEETLYKYITNTKFWKLLSIYQNKGVITISCDAKCSGYQHISGLIREVKWGELVGVYRNSQEKDLYEEISKSLIETLTKEEKEYLESINEFNPRNIVKRAVITQFYGVTKISIIKYIKEFIPITRKEYEREIQYRIAIKFLTGIFRIERSYKTLLDNIYIKFKGKRTKWVIPDGYIVERWYYRKKKVEGLKVQLDELRITFRGKIPIRKNNNRKIKISLGANLAHSLDAYFITKWIWSIDKKVNVIPQHDCIISSYENIDIILQKGIEVFKETYSNNILIKIFGDILDEEMRRISKYPSPNPKKWIFKIQ